MKVLVISHTYISPINRDKWKILAQRHPTTNIKVIFPKRWPTTLFDHRADIAPDEQTNNCSFQAIDTHKEGNELLYRYHHMPLFNLIKSFRPDVIHVEQGDGALSYFQTNTYNKLLNLNAKMVFFTWVNWHQNFPLHHRAVLKPIQKFNLTCSSGAVAGNHDAKKIVTDYGFTKKIMVLPQLGVNTAIFKPATSLNREKKYIGFVGRIIPEKGVFLLAQAFLKLTKDFPDWNLIYVGKGPATEFLHNFVTQHSLQNRIELYDAVPHEEIARFLAHLNILVLPSYDTPTWREQFGHVLIEAMASGVPIIGSNAGEIAHVIGPAGLIFQQQNESALLAQMQTLMQDEELRKTLGKKGLARVQADYCHEAIADKTYTFWQELLI